MRSNLVRALGVFCAVAAGLCPRGSGAEEPVKYSILYTGHLFGYFRYPNVQQVDQQGCPAGAVPSIAATEFLNHAAETPADLRLALGDNFAPDLLAVKMYDPAPAPGEKSGGFRARILYEPYPAGNEAKWRHRGDQQSAQRYPMLQGMLPSDPVGCFLQNAQFQAVVPGNDDFYFGPDYVSNLARFLHRAHGGAFPGVEMLGVNLIVSTVERHAAKPLLPDELPDAVRRALLPPPAVDPDDVLTITLPEDVLPWLREIKVKIPQAMAQVDFTADLCLAAKNNPNDCLAKTAQLTTLKPDDIRKKERTYSLELNHTSGEKGVNFLLLPDRNYAFCLHWTGENERRSYCKTFTVRQPLFQALDEKEAKRTDLGVPLAIDSGSPQPYYISQGEPQVVVFGVVDKTLMHQVGLLNYSWWNDNPKYETTVQAIDPAKALRQVLAMCEYDSNCRPVKHRILLAQMDGQAARQMITELQKPGEPNIFDAVLTQVDARDYSGSVSLSRRAGGEHDVAASGPLLLTPAPHYETPLKNKKLSLKMQRAELSFAGGADAGISMTNKVSNYELEGQTVAKAELFRDQVVKKTGVPLTKAQSKEPFELLALDRMRNYCKADLAMMQPRDVFEQFSVAAGLWARGDKNEQSDVMFTDENLMDEALWKGDVVVCRALSGADLNKTLKLSDGKDQLKKLFYLGVEKDNLHDKYIVGGQAVDDKRLYSVALTDYLAYGDTGYPDLTASDVGPEETIRSIKEYKLVAEAALEDFDGAKRGAVEAASALYDHVHSEPPVHPPSFDEIRQLGDWAEHWIKSYSFTPVLRMAAEAGGNRLEMEAQQRGYNYFNLEKMTMGYALTTIQGAQQLVPVKFGGISNVPQLQTLESQSVSVWERARFGHVFPKWVDIFGLGEIRYGFSRTRQTASGGYDPYKINITENALQFESGVLSKRISQTVPFRFLLSERLTTQLRSPLLSYSAPALGPAALKAPVNCNVTSIDATPPVTATTSANILCAAPRSILQETKIGSRLENKENWIEFGWESGHNFNSVTGYVLNRNTAAQLDCSATTNQSVTSCIAKAGAGNVTALSPLYVTQQTLPVSGWFFNFKIVTPVYAKTVQFSIENYSEVFLRHSQDTSADTRFYQDTVMSLPVKIWQNFSISPQVEVFNYQNKVLPQHFLSLASKLTLDYNFDWHSGLKASRAAGFPDAGTVSKGSALPVP